MGWTETHLDYGEKAKDYLDETFTWEYDSNGKHFKNRVLKSGIKNYSTYYAAIESLNCNNGEKEVFAVITLVRFNNTYFNFGYKDMDETYGPYQTDCPESILKLLTPTTNELAKQWREKCWNKIAKRKQLSKVKDGEAITIKIPYNLTSGWEKGDMMTIQKKGSKWISGYYRIPKRIIEDSEIVC